MKPCRECAEIASAGASWTVPEKTILIMRRLIVPVVVAAVTAGAAPVMAQGTFPAPLPGQTVQPNDPAFPPVPGQTVQRNDPAFPPVPGRPAPRNDPAFPPVNGSAPVAAIGPAPTSFPVNGAAPLTGGGFEQPAPPQAAGSDECMKNFMPLRNEAERRGKLIKAAGERHATPQEACKLIESFGQSELKMIKYVEVNASKCRIPAQIADQLKNGHKNTETMQKKVCEVAQQAARGPAGPSLSEVLGSAATVPEATQTKKGGSTFDTLNGNVLTR
jgi:hypothetical protein